VTPSRRRASGRVSGVFTMTPTDHSGLTKDALVIVTVDNKAWKVAG
jgi:branched-chain amino acid transport system substrate-binding protein